MGTHHKALHFPPELYRPITEQLNGDTTTLLAMSLTSRMTHQEATRVLYRHIVLRNPEQQRQFLHTIINSQSLSDLVYSWMYFISNAPDDPFTCLLSSAVPALRNLKQLGLNGHAIDDELMDHLELATFQLEAFYSNLYFFTRKERLLSWLSGSQRMITTLSLQFAFTWYPGTQAANSVKTLSLSSLVRVYGSRATLASILPFCPTVTEVFWEQHRDDRYTTEINPGLLSSLKQLRKLVFDWRLGLSMLPKIVTYIVNLEVLEVALSYIDVGFDALSWLQGQPINYHMPKLRWWIISDLPAPWMDVVHRDQLANILLQSNDNLFYVSIARMVSSRASQEEYFHYRRNEPKSVVKQTIPTALWRWFWGFHDDGYLQEGWDGSSRRH